MNEAANRGGLSIPFCGTATTSSVSDRRRVIEVVQIFVVNVNLLRTPGSAGHKFEFVDGHFVASEFVKLFHLSPLLGLDGNCPTNL
jgi:hypothetical protein